MRKSQAPSLNVKAKEIGTIPINCNGFSNFSLGKSENNTGRRSTESVLNLLSGVDCFDLEESNQKSEEVVFTVDGKKDHLIKPTNDDIEKKESQIELKAAYIKIFNVVYGKQSKKKHKTWEGDGILEVDSKYLTLKDENGKIIGRGPCPKARKLEEGVRLFVGSKEIELLESATENCQKSENHGNSIQSNDRNNSVNTRKPTVLCKRFQTPRLSYTFGMALPNPNAEHQWHFNQNGLPVTSVFVEESLSKNLRPHQCEGITFLYECIMGLRDVNLSGAILADEMGLGKTLQCIALIWTLLKQGPYGGIPVVKKVLIVTPSSLTTNWFNEFLKWLGRVKLVPFIVSPKNKPSDFKGSVMIVSYEMLIRCVEDIEEHRFDLLICDEGHRLKNSNIKTAQTLNRLNIPKRIILTGTPLQNDLNEFYTLVDFVNPNVLGTPSQFRSQFAEAILASRQPGASDEIIARGKETAQNLKKITGKFLMRRTRDILKNYLPPRHDVVVFCKIAESQKILYNSLIDSHYGATESDWNFFDGSCHLEHIIALKKICNHPSLNAKENKEKSPAIGDSGKLQVTVNFLCELQSKSPKEKVVVVSNSTQTLDLLDKIFHDLKFSTCRLDGSTPLAQRNKIVEKFNGSCGSSSSGSAFVFLLSSKAGGVGLNVTGASRLILFDSDWNPATDLQAISRIWRDGQKHPVYIYRLLTTGTIEEKIYQRQLSKTGLCDGTVDPENDKSIKLSKEELKELFFACEGDVDEDCLTHTALSCNCSRGGEVPVPEVEEEERRCQLVKYSFSALKISELFHWEHHGPPFDSDFLSRLCLEASKKMINFIFYN